jgi:hypothetical protein
MDHAMPPPVQGERHFDAGAIFRKRRHDRPLFNRSQNAPHFIIQHHRPMPGLIKHRGVRIVTLEPGDRVADHARPGDIMIEQREDGWYLHFIADDRSVDSYEDPFDSHTKALWSAKAAAEYQASGE